MKDPVMFEMELTEYGKDGYARQVVVEANQGKIVHDVYLFENGIMIPFDSISLDDQKRILDKVDSHFFMEDAYENR